MAPSNPPPGWHRLIIDEALVMTGAQFREVALPLLMLALWASPRSYAAALLVTLVPGTLLAVPLGRWADRRAPKSLWLVAYTVRIGGVVLLLLAHTVGAALLGVGLLGAAAPLVRVSMSHYLAGRDDGATRRTVARLRVVSSIARGTAPVLAGLFIRATDRDLGFLISLGCYAAAAAVVAGLPRHGPPPVGGGDPPPARVRLPGGLRGQIALLAAVSLLAWIANVLYTTYLLVTLRAGAIGFGVALALWGGAGLLSAAALGRVPPRRPRWVILAATLALAGSWTVMTRPVDFWVAVGLGVPEGISTWLLDDLVHARILMEAPAAQRASWTARATAGSMGGRAVGLALVVAVPLVSRVHTGFGLLALAATGVAAAWAVWLGVERIRGGTATSAPRAGPD